MNSSPIMAVGVFAGLLATSVATVAVKVRRWERDLEKRWNSFHGRAATEAREVTIDLPSGEPLQIEFVLKQSPIFCVHPS